MTQEFKSFKYDWPAIKEDDSFEARNIKELAYLYMKCADSITLALVMAAYHEWKK